MRASLIVAAMLAGSTFVGAQSPTWVTNPANGHVYALTPALGWAQAEAHANSHGAHLVTIRSPAEQAWIAQTFGNAGMWIGYTDQVQEGLWRWTSGEPTTYTNWLPGEPNNASNEDFATFSVAGWNDVEDTISIPGIMEIPPPFIPATYSVFGSGCALPSMTPPALAAFQGGVPRIGSTSRLRLSGLPVGIQVPVFVLGFSDTQNSGPLGAHALPFELSPLGFPGCWQYVSDDSTQFVLALNGYADWQITLPSYSILAGFRFYVQAAVPDAITGTVSLSNAVAAVIGY